jgi:hypothetical protein
MEWASYRELNDLKLGDWRLCDLPEDSRKELTNQIAEEIELSAFGGEGAYAGFGIENGAAWWSPAVIESNDGLIPKGTLVTHAVSHTLTLMGHPKKHGNWIAVPPDRTYLLIEYIVELERHSRLPEIWIMLMSDGHIFYEKPAEFIQNFKPIRIMEKDEQNSRGSVTLSKGANND